jgi:hypothetical protein
MKSLLKNNVQALVSIGLIVAFLVLGNFSTVFAQVMTSPSYSIQADSVNTGGVQSASASYKVEDTAGELATGDSSSTNFKLRAGYQQMTGSYIAMTSLSDVVMSPAIGGVGGGTSNGSSATTVTTDNPAGYSLYIKASSTPAMQGNANGDTIANYTPVSVPDFSFGVAATDAEFGFTPEGVDVAPEYLDNGIDTCSTGSSETANSCWGPITTTNELIATRSSGNHPSGSATTVKFRLTIGASVVKTEDDYTATTTLTAIAL